MESRARSAEAGIIWVLSILLALVFLTTGSAKLLGMEPIGLQAAAMRGFPGWVRTVVGLAEIAGAIALLVPAVASIAAVILAMLMVPATITQAISGEPGVLVPVVIGALLLFVAWRRAPGVVESTYHRAVATPRPLLREGVIVGVIGATIIAAWFFIVDLVAASPLFTPATLGAGLLRLVAPGLETPGMLVLVLSYTIVHYAAFIVVGMLAALIVSIANREPSILLGFVVLFAAMEVGFYAFTGALQVATSLGPLAWYNVMAGNVLATIGMGVWFWRTHPALRQQFTHALDYQPQA